jgi:hypothetical protein
VHVLQASAALLAGTDLEEQDRREMQVLGHHR